MKTFKTIIKDDLKKQGLAHIVSKIVSIKYESYAGGDSVRVYTKDLFKSDREKLKSILNQYQAGTFDGMTDSYDYIGNIHNKERQAKYVSLSNEFNEVVLKATKSFLDNDRGVVDDNTAMAKMGVWYDQAVWRSVNEIESYDEILKRIA